MALPKVRRDRDELAAPPCRAHDQGNADARGVISHLAGSVISRDADDELDQDQAT
jgi:hypothetical protein